MVPSAPLLASQARLFLRESRQGRHKVFDLLAACSDNLGQERSAHNARAPHDSTTDKSLQAAEQCLAGMLEQLPHLAHWPQLSEGVLKVVQELVQSLGKKLAAPSSSAGEAARNLHSSMQLLLELLELLPALVSRSLC